MKTCRTCGKQFPREERPPHRRVCPDCQKEARIARKVRNRARARAFIDDLNARTVCAHCGKQPVEWHNPEHVELNRQTFRIGFMVALGRTLAAIRTELARCTPLCRSCHMKEDGRLAAFKRNRGARPRNTNPLLRLWAAVLPPAAWTLSRLHRVPAETRYATSGLPGVCEGDRMSSNCHRIRTRRQIEAGILKQPGRPRLPDYV